MPKLETIDHVHVYAADRRAATEWYRRVLGLEAMAELANWATPDGPLFLQNREGTVALALFERPVQRSRATIAFRVRGEDFLKWQQHLREAQVEAQLEDHEVSWSLYFRGPDDAPFEITSSDYNLLKEKFADR